MADKNRDASEYEKLVREVELDTLNILRTNQLIRSHWLVISAALLGTGAAVATLLLRLTGTA
ncbi:hypothetical protein [Jannaschia sp. LMIT008]|uniref:hypothetical protein n=1 Tax=Jannaschia maritima TaxID=3032585 RepID=UPI0028111154|nr:hypothetical protein [Jannaschia sp. LMIT008]